MLYFLKLQIEYVCVYVWNTHVQGKGEQDPTPVGDLACSFSFSL